MLLLLWFVVSFVLAVVVVVVAVEACRTGNSGTGAKRVSFPDDQEWHQVIGRKKHGLLPKRPITGDRPLVRPRRSK